MARQSLKAFQGISKLSVRRHHGKAIAARAVAASEDGGAKRPVRVNVAPHVRMVNGKPVYVAGYSYTRTA